MADDIEAPDSTIDDAIKLISTKAVVEKVPAAQSPAQVPVSEPEEETESPIEPEEETESPDQETVSDDDIDLDDIEIEVTVDGETKTVPIRDLKKHYSGNGAIEKRLQEATESRNVVMQQANQLHGVLGQAAMRLQALDSLLEEAEAPEVDLEEIRIKDPTRYLFEKEKIREIQEKRAQIAQEYQNVTYQQEQLRRNALIQHSIAETKKLAEVAPEFADPDPENTRKAMQKLVEGASRWNFTPEEVNAVSDHRALLVLRDAIKWREYEARMGKAKGDAKLTPKQLIKPSIAANKTRNSTSEAKKMEILRAQARKSGHPDDIAATLLVRKGRR